MDAEYTCRKCGELTANDELCGWCPGDDLLERLKAENARMRAVIIAQADAADAWSATDPRDGLGSPRRAALVAWMDAAEVTEALARELRGAL